MNILSFSSRIELRAWFLEYAEKGEECWIAIKKGRPKEDGSLYYLDTVEEALCFGYIDSTNKMIDGVLYQRLSPRRKGSYWTELNKERARRLIKLGLMTELGKKTLPPLGPRSYSIDKDVEKALKEARVYKKFKSFHPLYQRVRAYNVAWYKKRDKETYERCLVHLVEETRKGKMYGEWNDYGRLLDY